MFRKYSLTGACQADLNTEIRYLLASAKVDGIELVKFDFPMSKNEKENNHCTFFDFYINLCNPDITSSKVT